MRSGSVFNPLMLMVRAFCVAILTSAYSLSYAFTSTSFEDTVKEITAVLKTGSAKRLSAHFSNNLHLSIKSDEGSYTKFQAELLLEDFFRTNKVTGLKEVQRARSSSSAFVVFSLQSGGNVYRVFIKIVQNNEQFEITELRIEAGGNG